MARKPLPIPKKAAEAWGRGDEQEAERLSKLRSRQLRNRLGPPGRAAAPPAGPPPPVAPVPAPAAQALVKLPRRPAAAAPPAPVAPAAPEPPPSSPEPTVEQIEALDTREEAEALYREVRGRMATADEVRYGALAEKSLAALHRIEQIDARRPKPQAPDEVTRRIVEVRHAAVSRAGILTSERAARFVAGREAFSAWCASLGPFGAEVRARVDAMLGGP